MTSNLATRSSLLAILLPVVLAAASARPAHAQAAPADIPEDPYEADDDDARDERQPIAPDERQPDEAPIQAPTQAPPSEQPPPPPASPPPRIERARPAPAQPAPPVASGQWVQTQQYGWVWMPYGDQYVYTPEGSGTAPYEYVYTPAYGWSWLVAPWVWGWGPQIRFSVGRPWYFGWYRHPHFVGRGYIRPGVTVRGFRGPVRGGFGFRGHVGIGGHIGIGHHGRR